MMDYNPREINEIPKIGMLRIGIPRVTVLNAFGELFRKDYEIVETDSPYLLWEDGTAMLWEDNENILLEQSKMKIIYG